MNELSDGWCGRVYKRLSGGVRGVVTRSARAAPGGWRGAGRGPARAPPPARSH
ncbi:hypothetical protein JYU34_000114 [Plutella xylostella]|uniref:Uncharacterized protein n=1 Tax=Plutella xylostella TaxID=51655 RepID=A0ABQ7R711_PLUXY|nr:hypothetical protein JYU34_000114 [Plutella xylostella]